MNYSALLGSAVWALLRNKLRSSLTVLGITIGIAAVIYVVAIGKAGQARVEQQLKNLGDNLVWIEAGGRSVNGVRTGPRNTTTLTMGDVVALKSQIPLIKSVSPNVEGPTQVIVVKLAGQQAPAVARGRALALRQIRAFASKRSTSTISSVRNAWWFSAMAALVRTT